MLKKLRKRVGKLWARVSRWPTWIAYALLDTCENILIGCLEAVNRGQEKMGLDTWDD